MMNATSPIDLLSKLLAEENITILRTKDATASFSLKSRTLRIPMFVGMTEHEELVFVAHEVGHAKFTNPDEYMGAIERNEATRKGFGRYMNIVEDARIERLMKEQYPGIRKDFFSGYTALLQRGFFGISSDWNEFSFADRVNIYFKGGVRTGVKFSTEELEIVRLIDSIKTVNDAEEAAIALYDFSLQQKVNARVNASEDLDDESGEMESGDDAPLDDEDYVLGEESEDDEDGNGDGAESESKESTDEEGDNGFYGSRSAGDSSEDEPDAPVTQDNFDKSASQFVDTDASIPVFFEPVNRNVVAYVPYKTFIDAMRAETTDTIANRLPKRFSDYREFMDKNRKVVSHMVKEFEMRRAAARYSREETAKSGKLDSRKIYAHKITADIFDKFNVQFDDVNHAFLFLLDHSGSMEGIYRDAIEQIITLTSFCRNVNIPFRVLAFSDNYNPNAKYSTRRSVVDPNVGTFDGGRLQLINVLDSKMNSVEYDYACSVLHTRHFSVARDPAYDYSGTPLVEALLEMYHYLPEFKRETGAEKLTFISITDGAGSIVGFNYPDGVNRYSYVRRFLRCSRTGKLLPFQNHRADIQRVVSSVLRGSMQGLTFLSFFVTYPKMNMAIRQFCTDNDLDRGVFSSLKRKGFVELNLSSSDRYFVIPVSRMDMDVDFGNIKADDSMASIAKNLSRSMGDFVKQRALATKIIELIS